MKRQSKSIVFARLLAQIFTRSLTLVPLAMALGGWLALTVNAAEEQRLSQAGGESSITNYEVAGALPPPLVRSDDPVQEGYGKTPSGLPLRSLVSESFTPREVEFQAPPAPPAPPTASPPSSKPESYSVYINENSSLLLQKVQQLQPTAFVRQYNGRAVIQAGVFNQNFNAQKLANELESKGIDTRIIRLTTGKDTDFVSNYKFYFVVIPAKQEKLAAIEEQVKQLKMGMQVNISQKEQPRTHVRVGPFLEKQQAENWKRYLKASGLRKARVYYGR